MEIREIPNIPRWTKTEAIEYLKIFKENEEYDAFSLDDNFNIIKGKGIIKNNNSYNYHNNYDDSENELYFTYTKHYKVEKKQQWTISEKEIKEICKREKDRVIQILKNKIAELNNE